MVTISEASSFALSFPEATELPHFENTSFRVKKKIFTTLNKKKGTVTVKLSEIDQSVFSAGTKAIYPVPGGWGKQGWTIIELKTVRKTLFKDAVTTAYCTVAPKKLSSLVRNDDL